MLKQEEFPAKKASLPAFLPGEATLELGLCTEQATAGTYLRFRILRAANSNPENLLLLLYTHC